MNRVRRLLIAILLLAVGYFLAVDVLPRYFPSDATWEAQMQADAAAAIVVLNPSAPFELPEEFWDRWDLQMEPYDDERLADLRSRLRLYLEFIEAEYAEAAEIYTTAADTRAPSGELRALRARLAAAFGPTAEKMVADADLLREDAYRLSPRLGGLDPDAPDFRLEAQSVRDWMTIARPRADALTTKRERR